MMDSHCGYEVVNHPVTLCGILGTRGTRPGWATSWKRRCGRTKNVPGSQWWEDMAVPWCTPWGRGSKMGQKWVKNWAGVLLCLYPQMNRDTNQPKQGILCDYMCFFLSTVYPKKMKNPTERQPLAATGFVFQSPPMAVRHLHRTRAAPPAGLNGEVRRGTKRSPRRRRCGSYWPIQNCGESRLAHLLHCSR